MNNENNTKSISVLVLRNKVVFPGALVPIVLQRKVSQQLVEEAYEKNELIAVVCQKDPKVSNPGAEDIHLIGVKAGIGRIMPMPDGKKMVILQAEERIHVDHIITTEPHLVAEISPYPELPLDDDEPELRAILKALRKTVDSLVQKMDNMPNNLPDLFKMASPELAINCCCCTIPAEVDGLQDMLELDDIKERAARLQSILYDIERQQNVKKVIKQKTDEQINKNQREYYLHQQMRAIRDELGDNSVHEVEELRKRAAKKHWPHATEERFEEELKKLERMDNHAPEYAMQVNYLDVMLRLPWDDVSTDNNDLYHAQRVLDKDHFGMEKVKERVLEYLAASRKGGMILCLYGPPGVGKTSLGKSIATALGRKYARISLGGLHDEAEIRGHRKTYIGAMPGRIIESLTKVGTSNPVFVLDEIDKLCADYHGDPTAALLEVLDPEQNKAFHDNYLDQDYDLSRILFIATANQLQSIPRPLLDRLELIEMTGYLQEEKEEICKHYLIPRQLGEYGLKSSELRFSAKAVRQLIDDYTRESGVRELERQVASVIRKVIKRRALDEPTATLLQPSDVLLLLGKARYTRDQYEGNDYPGVVTGLAWTQVGGEILFIETSYSESKNPSLTLTGNLGDVMKESANIALSYIRAHAGELGITAGWFDDKAIHLHVPEGAIPKDGPSAGITMTTAMVSAFTGKKVRARLAMTGEMTLRGRVMPVGGIKEKILAAKRAGITDIVLCQQNEKDIQEIPEHYLKGLHFTFVKDIHEVLNFALIQ